jgi:hypothetical protein
MINLLPPLEKENIIYGRKNRLMIRWVVSIIIVITGICVMTVFGQFFINKNVKSLEGVANITQDRIAKQNLASTQKGILNLSNNFTSVTQLLNKQVLFSKIFTKIGSIMPEGAILSSITLSTSNKSLDVNVIAKDREAATQAFVNLNDPKNGLFDKADLVTVGCQTKTDPKTSTSVQAQNAKYPCNALIKVTIKTDSSFYFLSSLTGNKKQ